MSELYEFDANFDFFTLFWMSLLESMIVSVEFLFYCAFWVFDSLIALACQLLVVLLLLEWVLLIEFHLGKEQ